MLFLRANADAQELSDALADDDALFAQLRSQGSGVMLRVAGEDEVGGRGQHFKAFALQLLDQRLATFDDLVALSTRSARGLQKLQHHRRWPCDPADRN